MNKRNFAILLCTVGGVLLAIAGAAGLRNIQKNDWIAQQVDTQRMHEVRTQTSLGQLKVSRLSGKTKLEGELLYSTAYYPEARTVLATVDLGRMEKPGFYLVLKNGQVVPGWYKSDLVKYNVTQVAFEGLLAEDFESIDFVDQANIPATGYDPKDASMPRVSFPLSLPPPQPRSWANPDPSSQG